MNEVERSNRSLCDKIISIRWKGKFYNTGVRSEMMYRIKCWVVGRKVEQRMSIIKMKILRWMNGVTRENKLRNEYIRGNIVIASIVNKMTVKILR